RPVSLSRRLDRLTRSCSRAFHVPPPAHLSPLSLHDALPISPAWRRFSRRRVRRAAGGIVDRHVSRAERLHGRHRRDLGGRPCRRSEEHTSELQSLTNLVCRLLLGNKKTHTRSAGTTTVT